MPCIGIVTNPIPVTPPRPTVSHGVEAPNLSSLHAELWGPAAGS